ncbi:hypothetical protein [Winogradskyella alexanderae]|uniref:Outer membrane protein beta-barrel domain-containing protein n=1 Tax=Winogradskyella alexanderae TaxID=2877123 RepID=A0ABS7XWU5_9FLAO|nr:hypothetical protein [Winogradskyella alexanderae]MCA0133301.1 hypothetical protein [Winogradskyella alexanderae]
MNTFTRIVVPLLVSFLCTLSYGQTKKMDSVNIDSLQLKSTQEIYKNEQIEKLKKQKENVEKQEREYLKEDIERINVQLDNGEITAEKAEQLKKEAAEKRAANIADKLAIIDKQIALYERTDKAYQVGMPRSDDDQTIIRIGGDEDTSESFIYIGKREYDKPRRYDKRTVEDFVFAIGFNNALIDGQGLDDSPYKLGGSGFVELGYAWKTRLFDNTNFWRLKYGFSFQWNKFDIKDNMFLVNNNDQIELQEFALDLDKAKFRTTNLVFPVHLEFGPSKKIERDDYFRYSTRNKLKIGLGGYAGFNIGSMQKLKYKDNGERVKDKQRSGFEVSEFVYGLSGYLAWGGAALYVKYDLNPLFKDQAIDQKSISVGLRFDMD